jgi:UDP-N-acetyl-D-mannosaminuronate dehydrogenase
MRLSKYSITEYRYPGCFGGCGTKWNFLPFKPGLVGGHCIGVDPYLAQKPRNGISSRNHGWRRLNDSMGICPSQIIND